MPGEAQTDRTGVIGGSGVYAFEGLAEARWEAAESAFGTPSDALLHGRLDGHPLVFLPRHGRGHRLSPSEIDYRANIDALKRAHVADVISVSAVGSLRADLAPGTFVIVDQFIDRTFARAKTFFEGGVVGHVSMAHPVCPRLGEAIAAAAAEAEVPTVRGGTYLVMEGPQFSTLAESELYRAWGADLIGMTNMPEAKLAREAELCYATVAMVTDYDCWHPDHDAVTVESLIRVLSENAAKAQRLIRALVPRLAAHRGDCPHGCRHALDHAVITAPEARDPAALARLTAVAGRVLGR